MQMGLLWNEPAAQALDNFMATGTAFDRAYASQYEAPSYTWPDVRPRTDAPRLSATLVLNSTPQQLADALDGLRISGGILLDKPKAKRTDDRYSAAHKALNAACTAVAALRKDHAGAEAVSDLVDRAFDLFEDTVAPLEHEAAEADEAEPTMAQEECDAERRAELRGVAA